MLARLIPGFFLLALAAFASACSSNSTTPSSGGVPGIGPNFATNTIYVANTSGQAIEIFAPNPAASAIPQYFIGGSSTGIVAPYFLAFDVKKNLFVTSYNAVNNSGSVQEIAQFATGNVQALNSFPLASFTRPTGIATFPTAASFAVGEISSGSFFTSAVAVYTGGFESLYIAGSNTQLNAPEGIATKGGNMVFVANSGSNTITVYTTPTPAPTVSPTATPVPTPTPTPPTPTPSPSPTPASSNIAPSTVITSSGAPLKSPMGIALDASGNLYVANSGGGNILVFNAPFGAGALNVAPSRVITSTSMTNPVDVKVDSSGVIYVIDQGTGASGAGKLIIFPANASGATTPQSVVSLAGTDTGLALSP